MKTVSYKIKFTLLTAKTFHRMLKYDIIKVEIVNPYVIVNDLRELYDET